jgi:hypothetical protein
VFKGNKIYQDYQQICIPMPRIFDYGRYIPKQPEDALLCEFFDEILGAGIPILQPLFYRRYNPREARLMSI